MELGVGEARGEKKGGKRFGFSVNFVPYIWCPVRSLLDLWEYPTEVWGPQSWGNSQLTSHLSFWLTAYVSVPWLCVDMSHGFMGGYNGNAGMVDLDREGVWDRAPWSSTAWCWRVCPSVVLGDMKVANSWEPVDLWSYHHGTRQPVTSEVQRDFVTEVVRQSHSSL